MAWLPRWTALTLALLLAASLATLSSGDAVAQSPGGQNWKDLAPDQRKQKRRQYFENLPEPQQQRLRENREKFNKLSGDQKRSLCQRFLEQNGYSPPACQQILGP